MATSKPNDGEESNETGSSSAASGWASWIQMAKNKSMSTFDLIKKDLAEFTQIVTQDTSKLVSGSTALVKDVLAKSTGGEQSRGDSRGIHQIVSSLTKTYAAYDDADAQPLRISGGTFETFDRYKARLQSIQTNPTTFCTDPDDAQDFSKWLSTFDVDGMKSNIAELLVDSGPIRALYTKLVPTALSHTVFWQRYFYRVHLLEVDEARKAKLKHRADKLQSEKDQLSWPDKDDWDRDDDCSTSIQRPIEACAMRIDDPLAAAAAAAAAVTAPAAAAGLDAGGASVVAGADAVAVAAGAELRVPATSASDMPDCASACPLPTDAAVADLVILQPLSVGADNCADDGSGEVPNCELGDKSLHSSQPQGSATLASITQTFEAKLPAAAAAAAAEPDTTARASSVAAAPTALPAYDVLTSPVLVDPLDSHLKAPSGYAASAEKESLTEPLVDLQQDPNFDSDWEKEFDVAEELVAAAAAVAGQEQTTDTDRDLEWETWE